MISQTEKEQLRALFTQLIQADTRNPPGNERNAAIMLWEWFALHGIQGTIQELGSNRANFTVCLGSGTPVLEWNGHLDVVPCTGEWKTPPLTVAEQNGRFYGRGACDMKGGIAAMCIAALSLAQGGGIPCGTLRLCFVADEEDANRGVHAFQKAYPAADYAVIGEPTDLRVAVAHRGVARMCIEIYGEARHAALPAAQETAVTNAARAVLALHALNASLCARTHAVLPPPTVSVTRLAGYEKDNVIPGTVQLLTDYRLLPDMTEASACADIEKALYDAGVERFVVTPRFYMPGGALASDDAFVRQCCGAVETVLGAPQQPCAFGASCEQCFLLAAGTRAVICGPGSLTQAHTVDEYVQISQLEQAVACYKAIAKAVLKGEKL